MSILIKGMEMPKSCWGCPFSAHYDPDTDRCLVTEKLFEANWARFNDRLPDCPLVPVPPHGRLIDVDCADEYAYDELELAHGYLTGWEAARNMQKIYQNAPTIIEAEG